MFRKRWLILTGSHFAYFEDQTLAKELRRIQLSRITRV